MEGGDKFFAVTLDKRSWSRDPMPVAHFEARGYTVQDARLHGDKDVFYEGRAVATLFASKADAAKYLHA